MMSKVLARLGINDLAEMLSFQIELIQKSDI